MVWETGAFPRSEKRLRQDERLGLIAIRCERTEMDMPGVNKYASECYIAGNGILESQSRDLINVEPCFTTELSYEALERAV
jgi:hypothetical protein